MAKKSQGTGNIGNKRARFDYELGDSMVVGLQLTGPETKALRLGHGQLRGAYVTVKDNELWLINAQINGSNGVPLDEDQQTRSRKVLAKRSEIDKLIEAKNQSRTIVPLEIMVKTRYIKLRIAVGKGRKHYDKRQNLKQRQQQRDIAREMK